MKLNEDTKLWFECTLGKTSKMNLAGKIILSPLIVYVGVIWIIMDFLFLKKE